jgi:hypothetical protein
MNMSFGDSSDLPLFVGLTTLPSRIQHMRQTLDSLMAQTRVPDRVLLCLPRMSRREGCVYERPQWLADYAPILEVVECKEDWGPGTKLLGCLDHITQPTCLVIADDDMRYRPFFLEGLYRSQVADTASSFSYWAYPCGPFMVGQGADGFSFFSPNLAGMWPFANKALQSPQLRVVDDLWISAFLKHRGVAVKSIKHLIPDQGLAYEVAHSVNQLQDMGGDLGRETAMIAGTRYLLESGLLGRQQQGSAILKKVARRAREALMRK